MECSKELGNDITLVFVLLHILFEIDWLVSLVRNWFGFGFGFTTPIIITCEKTLFKCQTM